MKHGIFKTLALGLVSVSINVGAATKPASSLPDLVCEQSTESEGHGGTFAFYFKATINFSKPGENPYANDFIKVESKDLSLGISFLHEYGKHDAKATEVPELYFISGQKQGSSGTFSFYLYRKSDREYVMKSINVNEHWGDSDSSVNCRPL